MMTKALNVTLAAVAMVSMVAAIAAAQATSSAARKVTIAGRLLYEDKSPIVGIRVMVMETESKDGRITTTWKTGPDGTLANPSAVTDNAGRFSIEAAPSFWASTGDFTVSGGFLPGTTTNAGILLGPGQVPMLLSIDAKTNKVDLGDIVVVKK